MTKEIWRRIPGFMSYAASNKGRVKRTSAGKGGTWIGKIMKQSAATGGYKKITLVNDNTERKTELVHRLINLAFKGSAPSSKHEVAHWDGNKANNKPSNLRWATRAENSNDRHRHGTMLNQAGSKNHNAKSTEAEIRKMKRLRISGVSRDDLAKRFKMHPVNVSRICNGHIWSHVNA